MIDATFWVAISFLLFIVLILYKKVPKFTRPTRVPRLIADTSQFRKLTAWKPKILFDDILLDTLEFWREKVKKKDFI